LRDVGQDIEQQRSAAYASSDLKRSCYSRSRKTRLLKTKAFEITTVISDQISRETILTDYNSHNKSQNLMETARGGVESGAHFVFVQVISPVASAASIGAVDGEGDALREWYVPPSLSHRIAEKMSQSVRDATAHHEHNFPNTGLSIHIDPRESADTEHAIVKLTTKERTRVVTPPAALIAARITFYLYTISCT
jgi:hypothetical protein